MAENDTPWILDKLNEAAERWDERPEWTKPVISAPYFAARADMRPASDKY